MRKAAIESTFALLGDEAGVADGALDGEFGARVFRELLLPLLGPPATEQDAASSSAQAAWARSTGIAAVVAVERLFCAAHAQLDGQLEELVAPLVRCLHQREHGMAQVAAESLLHLVKEAGASFERDTWTSICSELKTRFVGKELPVELSATESNGADPSPLLREVSAKVEAEAPPGSGPHELQVLLLSTVFQLMQSMYSSMKLSDVEGLLNCMHDMYDKAHRVVQAALQGEVRPSPTELDEALHLQLEAARYFLEVLLDLFGKMGPGPHDDLSPSKAVLPPLGSEEHVLLVASTAEHRLVSFGAHVLRDYLEVQRRSQDADADQGELARTLSRELTPNVLTLLKGILEFHGPQFTRCARTDAPPPHCTAHAPRYLHDPRAGCATHAANRHSATLPHRASRAQASPGLLPPLRGAHALRRGAGEIGVARHPLDARRKHAARSASLRILDLVSCARRESATRRAQLEVGKG